MVPLVIVLDETPSHQPVIVLGAALLPDLDLVVPLLGPVLLVILQKLLERHDPERPFFIEPFHRVVEALAQKGLDPLLIALDLVHIEELVLKRAFLEFAELGI
jgi:hypothetical protein